MSEPSKTLRKVIPIVASSESGVAGDGDAVMVSLYEAQKKIYPRSVSGLFSRWRWILVALTQLVFYGVPWLEWGHRQAVLFDLEARRFYIFNLVLYPQDFIYLTGILVISVLTVRILGGPFREMRPYADLFFMGAAFLLLETKNIATFALLFGTTWLVNGVVITGVMLLILAANLLAERFPRLPLTKLPTSRPWKKWTPTRLPSPVAGMPSSAPTSSDLIH